MPSPDLSKKQQILLLSWARNDQLTVLAGSFSLYLYTIIYKNFFPRSDNYEIKWTQLKSSNQFAIIVLSTYVVDFSSKKGLC